MPTTTTGKATEFIQFTRASNATVTDSDGKIKWAPHNLLLASESFDAASYGTVGLLAFGSGSSANSAAAPNGTTTAEYLRETNANSRHFIFANPSTVAGANYTARVFVKAGERTFVALGIRTTDGVTGYAAAFNLSTGAMTATSSTGTPTNTSAPTPVAVGSGWYLLSVSMDATTSSAYVEIGLSDSATPTFAAGMPTYTGTGTSGLYLWGAHLYRSDLGGMQANTSAYPMYNPTSVKNLVGYTEPLTTVWNGTNGGLQGNGSELVTNGDFVSSTGWTQGGTLATIGGGVLSFAAITYNVDYQQQTISITAGKTYRITGTISNYSAGQFQVDIVGVTTVLSGIAANGTFHRTYVATSTANAVFRLSGVNSLTADLDNFSIQEVPVYQAPNGLQTARAVEATSANGTLLSSLTLAAIPYTFSVWLKRKTGTGNVQLTVDGTTYSTVSVTSEWQRFSTTLTPSAGTRTPGIRLVTSGDAVYVWGAQLSDSASLDTYSPVYGAAVTSAAYYGPRRDFDPVTLACKGLLVEEQRSNLMTYSADISQWTAQAGVTVTVNQAVAPDGTMTADLITGNGTAGVISPAATVSGASNNTKSIWLRAVTGTTSVILKDGNFTIGSVTCNLTTTWQRFTLSETQSGGIAGIWIDDIAAGGIYAWGGQIEQGSFATSYIPTGSATATRNADVASVSTQAFPYSATEGTLVAFASSALLPSSYTNGRVACLNDTTSNNVIELYISQNASDTVNAAGRVMLGGVQQTNPSKTITNNANPHKVAFAYKASDFAVTGDGLSPTTLSSGSLPSTITQMQLGALLGGNYLNGHIRQITYLPRRISNTELQTRTQ